MPTYEYFCNSCRLKHEIRHGLKDAPETVCPSCGGALRRLISGGTGFILKSPEPASACGTGGGCSLERTGQTCCGNSQRCGKPSCDETP